MCKTRPLKLRWVGGVSYKLSYDHAPPSFNTHQQGTRLRAVLRRPEFNSRRWVFWIFFYSPMDPKLCMPRFVGMVNTTLKGISFYSPIGDEKNKKRPTNALTHTHCHTKKKAKKNLRSPGIEPGSITWQATIITTRPRTLTCSKLERPLLMTVHFGHIELLH